MQIKVVVPEATQFFFRVGFKSACSLKSLEVKMTRTHSWNHKKKIVKSKEKNSSNRGSIGCNPNHISFYHGVQCHKITEKLAENFNGMWYYLCTKKFFLFRYRNGTTFIYFSLYKNHICTSFTEVTGFTDNFDRSDIKWWFLIFYSFPTFIKILNCKKILEITRKKNHEIERKEFVKSWLDRL